MSLFLKSNEYRPSMLLKSVQVVLLALIIVGIGLLGTQKFWVPHVVEYILEIESQASATHI